MSLKGRTVRLLSSALYHTRLVGPLAAAIRVAAGGGFPILTFHRVNDDQDPFFPALPTAVFAKQIAHVARHYRVLAVEELVERNSSGTVPANALALTFDDGYRDNLTHAAPILAQHGLPATIFLATGYIGTPDLPWFDRVALAFKLAQRQEAELPGALPLRLETPGARLAALGLALGWLKSLPDDERRRAVDRLTVELRPRALERPKRIMLSWEEVDALRGLGFSIGAHTVSHPILSRMRPERAREEILGSKTAIERALGGPPRAFAYPNGRAEDYTATTVRLVQECGFTCAVTTRLGVNSPGTSPFELHRGGPWEHHLPTFALKLACYGLWARGQERTA
ncbi:MAG TPA: polysaccharide deacetylase family protein [Methylomirabilota bacterium]|nr:polysaccharide deacetylase family protein [Methylomirabilota bacterium]